MTVPCHPTIVDRGTAATRTAAGRG
jgi:hypothetical protein